MSRRQYTPLSSLPEDAPQLVYVTQDRYSKDWNSNLHTHGCAELFFITGGHGRFCTRREEFPVAIHDAVIVNANVPHTEVSQLDSPLEYTVLGVEGLETLAGAEGYTMLHLHTGWEELMACLELIHQEAGAPSARSSWTPSTALSTAPSPRTSGSATSRPPATRCAPT